MAWRIVFQDLAATDVRVVDVETGRASDEDSARLLFGVKGLFADQYLQAVRRQTHRGLEGRALAGFHTGGRTFGYATVEEPTPPDPEHPRRISVVDRGRGGDRPSYLRVVRFCASLRSDRRRAESRRHARTAHDGGRGNKGLRGWGHTTVRAMLSNERYTDQITWNTHKWLRVPGKRHTPTGCPAGRRARDQERRGPADHRRCDLGIRVKLRLPHQQAHGRLAGRPNRDPVGAGHLLSGLLKCGACGGSFGLVSRRLKAGETYQTLGCVTHKSRGSAICANEKTISERKVRTAVVEHLRNVLTRPDRIEAFIDEFQRRYRELLETSESRLKSVDGEIARQRKQIDAVLAALVTVPRAPRPSARASRRRRQS